MKKIIALLCFLTTPVWAGLPPTTSKVSGDSSDITTFKYQFPNFTGTHTGTTISLGVNSIAGGGTGQGTKAAAFDALSPMSASGDIIYGGASGTGTRLPKAADGTFLSLVSGVPAWTVGSYTVPNSEITYSGTNGHGSTNITVVRWLTSQVSTGSDLTFADSSTLGSSITVNTAGVYSVSATLSFSGGGMPCGVTINSLALSSSMSNISYANGARNIGRVSAASSGCTTHWEGHLSVNDVIRIQDDGNGDNAGSAPILTVVRIL